MAKTEVEFITALTWMGEPYLRHGFIEWFGNFVGFSKGTKLLGHVTSRFASYVNYFYSYNRKNGKWVQRINPEELIFGFMLPVIAVVICFPSNHAR